MGIAGDDGPLPTPTTYTKAPQYSLDQLDLNYIVKGICGANVMIEVFLLFLLPL